MTDDLRTLLLDRRKLMRIGQRELAQQLGVSQSTVSALENGKAQKVDFDILLAWASALGGRVTVTVDFNEVLVPSSSTIITSEESR